MNETRDIVTAPPAAAGEANGVPAGAPQTFADMNLLPAIQKSLDDMGFQAPMDVQRAVYNAAMAGDDLMVQSRTGSGKTAAFGIPLVQRLSQRAVAEPGAAALLLAPTRELALQVAHEMTRICANLALTVVPIYGGAPMGPQVDALKAGAEIIVGTPGRVLDHIRRGTLKTKGIEILVLDECDEMLSMGFQEEIEAILQTLPVKEKRQTLLFSATIPPDIERIATRYMRRCDKIILSTGNVGVSQIAHSYYMLSGLARANDLLRILQFENPESAIIFCNTREDTNVVSKFLQRSGYDAEAISSDLAQRDRERVMKRMRDKNLKFLCATDIAARGIDIQELDTVINYTFPESAEVYVHRTGRTGRAGRSGEAISLIGPRELGSLYYLKLLYKIRPVEKQLPSTQDLKTRREGERYLDVVARVTTEPSEEWRSLARRVWHSAEGERIVAALIEQLVSGAAIERPKLTERPRPVMSSVGSRESASRQRTDTLDERPPRRRDSEAPRARDARSGSSSRDRGPRDTAAHDQGSSESRPADIENPQGGTSATAVQPTAVQPMADARPLRDESPPVGDNDARPTRELRALRGGDLAAAELRSDSPGSDSRRPPLAVTGNAAAPSPIASPTSSGFSMLPPLSTANVTLTPLTGPATRPERAPERPPAPRAPEREPYRAPSVTAVPAPQHAPAALAATDGSLEDGGEGLRRRRRSNREERTVVADGSVRLYVNIGKRENVTPETLTTLFSSALGPGVDVGRVVILGTHSYVNVPGDCVDKAIDTLGGQAFGDRELVIEPAKA